MGYVHEMVVNDAGEIVSCHPVRANNDEIAYVPGTEIHPSMDEVIKGDGFLSHTEPEDGVLAFRLQFRHFFTREGSASSVIPGHFPL
jgi:hypothetical protein